MSFDIITYAILKKKKADLINGKVPESQLPSYIDEVVEVPNKASLPATGDKSKIYLITIGTGVFGDRKGSCYRWGGTEYALISDAEFYVELEKKQNKLVAGYGIKLTDESGDPRKTKIELSINSINLKGAVEFYKDLPTTNIEGDMWYVKNDDADLTHTKGFYLWVSDSGTKKWLKVSADTQWGKIFGDITKQTDLMEKFDGKVDSRTTTTDKKYAYTLDKNGDTVIEVATANTANTIAQRDAAGNISVNLTPSQAGHAASKKYVDDKSDKKIDLLGNESGSKAPYNFPYHISNLRYDDTDKKLKATLCTITLDNKKTLKTFPLEVEIPDGKVKDVLVDNKSVLSESGIAKIDLTKKVDRNVKDDNNAINTIDNSKGQMGSMMSTLLSDNDTVISFNTASENGPDGILGQIYAKSLLTGIGMRFNITKKGIYYNVGSSTPIESGYELLVRKDIDNKLDKVTTITPKEQMYVKHADGTQGMADIPEGAAIDTQMSDVSVNAVQNKVIKHYVDAAESGIRLDLEAEILARESGDDALYEYLVLEKIARESGDIVLDLKKQNRLIAGKNIKLVESGDFTIISSLGESGDFVTHAEFESGMATEAAARESGDILLDLKKQNKLVAGKNIVLVESGDRTIISALGESGLGVEIARATATFDSGTTLIGQFSPEEFAKIKKSDTTIVLITADIPYSTSSLKVVSNQFIDNVESGVAMVRVYSAIAYGSILNLVVYMDDGSFEASVDGNTEILEHYTYDGTNFVFSNSDIVYENYFEGTTKYLSKAVQEEELEVVNTRLDYLESGIIKKQNKLVAGRNITLVESGDVTIISSLGESGEFVTREEFESGLDKKQNKVIYSADEPLTAGVGDIWFQEVEESGEPGPSSGIEDVLVDNVSVVRNKKAYIDLTNKLNLTLQAAKDYTDLNAVKKDNSITVEDQFYAKKANGTAALINKSEIGGGKVDFDVVNTKGQIIFTTNHVCVTNYTAKEYTIGETVTFSVVAITGYGNPTNATVSVEDPTSVRDFIFDEASLSGSFVYLGLPVNIIISATRG